MKAKTEQLAQILEQRKKENQTIKGMFQKEVQSNQAKLSQLNENVLSQIQSSDMKQFAQQIC